GLVRRLLAGLALGLRVLAVLLALATLLALVAFIRVAPIDVRGLATREPGRSALMREREREALDERRPYFERRHWVPLERVAATLRGAVLVAEDDKFFTHDGLGWNEIRGSAAKDIPARHIPRGGRPI